MSSLNEILKSTKVQRFSGSNQKLFEYVQKLAKENVGHGISAEYYATHFEFGGLINPSNIGAIVKNAKYNRGAFAKQHMQLGLKIYWAKKKAEKAIRAEVEKSAKA